MNDPVAAQRRMWTIGDYPTIAEHLRPISAALVDAIRLRRGDAVLDVGVGTGNAAIEATRRGAYVTGIDLAPAMIERAGKRCLDEGVEVVLGVGDVQALDIPDATFDAVISVLGMIFAPDNVRALAEMARVCVPGGTVAIATWAVGGWSTVWWERAAAFVPPPAPGAPRPAEWGEADEVARRFRAARLDVTVEQRRFAFRFPSKEAALRTFVDKAGPFVVFMEAMTAQGRAEEALDQLRAVIAATNRAADGTCVLPAPFLLAIGRR